ncbi:MAG: DUF151 domain-containing protein [Candidatus Aenigmatarchaeota archaeon]
MAKKNKSTRVLIIFVLTILIIFSYFFFQSIFILKKVTSTDGYIEMQVKKIYFQNDLAFITLSNDCFQLDFYTTPQQAESIRLGIENKISFRPTSHDTIKSILETYKIKPIIVKIIKMEENTYFAEITFQKGFQFMTLDVKPTDAIAIAVRTNTPIYVNSSLAKKFC